MESGVAALIGDAGSEGSPRSVYSRMFEMLISLCGDRMDLSDWHDGAADDMLCCALEARSKERATDPTGLVMLVMLVFGFNRPNTIAARGNLVHAYRETIRLGSYTISLI